MKLFILNVKDDEFTNRENGEIIRYRNCQFVDFAEKSESSTRKGHEVIKTNIAPGVIDTVKPSEFPGWFECETMIGRGGKMVISKMVSIPSANKLQAAA